MGYREQKRERVDMARQITSYISTLGVNTPWIEGKGVINKASQTFTAKFWWFIIYYRLFTTITNNLLTRDIAALIARIVEGYDINFVAIINQEVHERAFRDIVTLPFPFLIQMLCDMASMPEFPSVDARVEVMGMAQTSMIKDSTNSVHTQ